MTKLIAFCLVAGLLPCMAMLSGNVDAFVGQSSVRKRQVGVLERVKPAPSVVSRAIRIVWPARLLLAENIVVNTSIGAAILFSCHPT